jgi:hypothetical protein
MVWSYFNNLEPRQTETLILELQFVGDHLPCQLFSRHSPASRIRLGKYGRPRQKDGYYKGLRGCVSISQPVGDVRCVARFDPAVHVAISRSETGSANGLQVGAAAAGLSVPLSFDHRTTCTQEAEQNRALSLGRFEGTDCLTP